MLKNENPSKIVIAHTGCSMHTLCSVTNFFLVLSHCIHINHINFQHFTESRFTSVVFCEFQFTSNSHNVSYTFHVSSNMEITVSHPTPGILVISCEIRKK